MCVTGQRRDLGDWLKTDVSAILLAVTEDRMKFLVENLEIV